MNNSDAIKILNLSGDLTPDIIKKAYKKACITYNPYGNPAGLIMMKAVNSAYRSIKHFSGFVNEEEVYNFGDQLNTVINQILDINGLRLELYGSWLWVTGKTYENKETLKNLGFIYAFEKKAWFMKPLKNNTGLN